MRFLSQRKMEDRGRRAMRGACQPGRLGRSWFSSLFFNEEKRFRPSWLLEDRKTYHYIKEHPVSARADMSRAITEYGGM